LLLAAKIDFLFLFLSFAQKKIACSFIVVISGAGKLDENKSFQLSTNYIKELILNGF
jgi:hypothetical protein